MIDERMDKEQMKQPAQPWEFRSKPSWQRLLIMIGGVLVNFILALFIYAMVLFVWGDQYLSTKNVKHGIMCDSLAYEIGFKDGDKILSVEGKYIDNFYKIFPEIVINQYESVLVERNGKEIEIRIPSELNAKLIKSKGIFDVRIPFIANEFSENSVGKKAGIKQGDQIVSINGNKTEFYDEVKDVLSNYANEEIVVGILRNQQKIDIPVQLDSMSVLGIRPLGELAKLFEITKKEYTFLQSIPVGIKRGLGMGSSYLKQMKLLFNKEAKAYKSLGGFITIGSIFSGVWDWESFWLMTAFLSIVLAIMNILPIPALDGGHVLFLIYEIVTGRKPSDKFLEYAQLTGMIIILALVIFANANDIIRLFT